MTNRSKSIIATTILVVVIVAIAAGVYAYIHKQNSTAKKTAQSQSAAQQAKNQGPKWINTPANPSSNLLIVQPGIGLTGLPLPKNATIILNRHYIDIKVKPPVLHYEYEYTQPNSTSGSTIQQSFLASLQSGGWKNIQSSNSKITATLAAPQNNNYNLTATFSSQDSKNTIIDIQYTDEK
jgi:hypothetical protein